MTESHLATFERLMKATNEVKGECGRRPISLAQIAKIADRYNIPTHELLASLSISPGYIVDYQKGEVRCLTR